MIKILKGNDCATVWWNIVKPTGKEVDSLKRQFALHPVNIADIVGIAKHPKIDKHQNYSFTVMLFPIYDRKSRAIFPFEMDFILGTDYLLTVHDNKFQPVARLVRTEERILHSTGRKNSLLAKPPSFVMHKILEELFLYIYPIMDHITEEIDEIEKSIFQGKYRQMVDEILMTKRKIVNLRRIMQSHKNIIRKLIDKDIAIQRNSEVKVYFEDLIDRAKEIWQILESQNEHINALHATNESLISFRLNDIMKTLTIFSVVVFPLTLIAAIFGMNTQTMPLVNNKHGFWFIIGAMSIGTLCMFLFFKKKNWL